MKSDSWKGGIGGIRRLISGDTLGDFSLDSALFEKLDGALVIAEDEGEEKDALTNLAKVVVSADEFKRQKIKLAAKRAFSNMNRAVNHKYILTVKGRVACNTNTREGRLAALNVVLSTFLREIGEGTQLNARRTEMVKLMLHAALSYGNYVIGLEGEARISPAAVANVHHAFGEFLTLDLDDVKL